MASTLRERAEKLAADLDTDLAAIDAKGDTASAEDVERVNKMTGELSFVITALQAQQAAGGNLDVSKAFLASLNGKVDTADVGHTAPPEVHSSGIVNPKGMTLGEALIKSPAYTEFLAQYKGADGQIRAVQGLKSAEFSMPGFHSKALITGLSDTSGGAFVVTNRLPITADLIGQRELYVRDLCTNINITSDTFDFVTVTTKTNAAATVLEPTTSATPGLNNVAVGAYTAAHGVKPESTLAFAVVTAIVETIAHTMPITRRAAADGGAVMDLVNAFLLYGLAEEEEDQILNGNGTTPNIRGILQTVGISTVGSAGTDLDAIVDAIRTVRVTGRRTPNAIVMHPNDWFSTGFLLAKDTTGRYIVGDPAASLDSTSSLWGLRVVVTEAMTENTALVGDFKQYVVADRQQAAIYITDSHNDHFVRNILDVLAEERIAGGCLDPEAFCTVTAV
jgi:HK97 family phage major capsid protein